MPQKLIDQTTIQPDGRPGDDAFTAFATCNENFQDTEQRLTALGARIDQEAADRGQYVEAESTIRAAADSALSQSIAAVSARIPDDNYLINGQMDVWQLGDTFTWAESRRYTADQWIAWAGGGKQLFVERRNMFNIGLPAAVESVRPKNAMYIEVSVGGTGNDAFALIQQLVEGVHKLSDSSITTSMVVWADKATKIGVGHWQNYDDDAHVTVVPPTLIQLQPGWQYVQVTKQMPAVSKTYTHGPNSHISLNIWLASGSEAGAPGAGVEAFAMWLTNVKMESGTAATVYRPQRESDVLVQCQRYFEKSYNLGTAPGTATRVGGHAAGLQTGYLLSAPVVRFSQRKRTSPAIIVYNTQDGAAGQISENDVSGQHRINHPALLDAIGAMSFEAYVANGTGTPNNVARFQWTADARL